ncbi:MAG: hypothetical protein ACPL4K_04605, partial [Candidatus Margulisiibacteriota bacterium]
SFEILELHSRVETLLLMRACETLSNNPNDPSAKNAFLTIMRETREPFLIEYGLKFARQQRIKLTPKRRTLRPWISDLLK